eukprot:TRINITY_DN17095_c0_g1_i2.p1 TRINITY_DN17095_c0_g1~~TRINITY_DN17095_c0_g1_i2.p1  ORF type:complete len:926 (+),score=195.04 TRINITY_DN17095_c0_g1_i2:76-2853(+)
MAAAARVARDGAAGPAVRAPSTPAVPSETSARRERLTPGLGTALHMYNLARGLVKNHPQQRIWLRELALYVLRVLLTGLTASAARSLVCSADRYNSSAPGLQRLGLCAAATAVARTVVDKGLQWCNTCLSFPGVCFPSPARAAVPGSAGHSPPLLQAGPQPHPPEQPECPAARPLPRRARRRDGRRGASGCGPRWPRSASLPPPATTPCCQGSASLSTAAEAAEQSAHSADPAAPAEDAAGQDRARCSAAAQLSAMSARLLAAEAAAARSAAENEALRICLSEAEAAAAQRAAESAVLNQRLVEAAAAAERFSAEMDAMEGRLTAAEHSAAEKECMLKRLGAAGAAAERSTAELAGVRSSEAASATVGSVVGGHGEVALASTENRNSPGQAGIHEHPAAAESASGASSTRSAPGQGGRQRQEPAGWSTGRVGARVAVAPQRVRLDASQVGAADEDGRAELPPAAAAHGWAEASARRAQSPEGGSVGGPDGAGELEGAGPPLQQQHAVLQQLPPDKCVAEAVALVEQLDRGSFGEVWRGTTAGGASVAVKIPLGKVAISDTVDEFNCLLQCQGSPYVLRLFGWQHLQSGPALLTEMCEGGNLGRVVCSLHQWQVEISWASKVRWWTEALRGLAAVHESGLLHLDFKGQNLLLSAEGVVKLADFGTAMPMAAAEEGVAPPRGTWGMMAPEMLGGDPVGPAADMYSAGVTALFLFALRLPSWAYSDGSAVVAEYRPRLVSGEILPHMPATVQGRAVPEMLAMIVNGCLARDPSWRTDAAGAVEQLQCIPPEQLSDLAPCGQCTDDEPVQMQGEVDHFGSPSPRPISPDIGAIGAPSGQPDDKDPGSRLGFGEPHMRDNSVGAGSAVDGQGEAGCPSPRCDSPDSGPREVGVGGHRSPAPGGSGPQNGWAEGGSLGDADAHGDVAAGPS